MQLGDVLPGLGAQRLAHQAGSTGNGGFHLAAVAVTVVLRVDDAAVIGFGVLTGVNPRFADGRNALGDVNLDGRVGIRAGGIVHGDGLTVGELDGSHRHTDVRVDVAGDIGFLGGR